MKFDENRKNSPIPTIETRFMLKLLVYFDLYSNISIISEQIGSKYRNNMPKPPMSFIFLSIMNEVLWKNVGIHLYRPPRLVFCYNVLYILINIVISLSYRKKQLEISLRYAKTTNIMDYSIDNEWSLIKKRWNSLIPTTENCFSVKHIVYFD